MKLSRLWFVLPVVAVALAFAATGCGGSSKSDSSGGSGGELVFGTASDPVVLDGALVSDGESLRPIDQMFEGLVTLKEGTTEVVPALATSWKADAAGTAWTFNLREGVKFHDGTEFNADAVCFNFDRWYNFKGPFQLQSATYYWQTVFGGFSDKKTPSLYKSCEVKDDHTVVINLTKPSASFLGALALTNFTIASPDALQKYGADKGSVDEETGFKPTGTYGTQHPTGTGPFKFVSWTRGDRLVMERNDDYWGDKAKLDRLIFRPISDNAARLQALQSGEIQGYDLVEPQDVKTIEGDDSLQILDRPAFNVGYVTINQKVPPFDKIEVRQAVAAGLDREAVVSNFYAGRGEVAKEFMPPSLEGYSDDVQTYTYDPAKAKSLLQKAGVKIPLKVDFWYPTDVSRPYMPDPKRNFEAFAASLNKSGFKVVPHSAPWSPDYVGRVDGGKAGALNLIGWTGDYGDPDNFIGTFFQQPTDQFGFENEEIFNTLNNAEKETDAAKRTELYKEANEEIMRFLPGVPYVHTKPALAFEADVKGYVPSPVSLEPFSIVSIEK
ncbi:MAG TPA: ABC transporter substrate-binding protein [Gaiellaceae bacterium]|jgi:peptide/nickel transport system substrate-binding protein